MLARPAKDAAEMIERTANHPHPIAGAQLVCGWAIAAIELVQALDKPTR
jgi:hypothetical protein